MLNFRFKWTLAIAALLSLGLGVWVVAQDKGKAEKPPTEEEKSAAIKDASYAFGFQVGTVEGQKNFPLELVDFAEFVEGMKAALKSEDGRVTNERYREVAKIFQAIEIDRRQKQADANAKFAEEFLSKNGKGNGVQTMGESRLQYVIADKGKGPKQPKSTDWVKVHYEGRLVEPGKDPKDFKVFDSTKKAGKPADMPMSNLIEGWKQALGQMKEGAKWNLWIPPELAYDEEGHGRVIPPNSVLYFELELIKILTKEEREVLIEKLRKEQAEQQGPAEE